MIVHYDIVETRLREMGDRLDKLVFQSVSPELLPDSRTYDHMYLAFEVKFTDLLTREPMYTNLQVAGESLRREIKGRPTGKIESPKPLDCVSYVSPCRIRCIAVYDGVRDLYRISFDVFVEKE